MELLKQRGAEVSLRTGDPANSRAPTMGGDKLHCLESSNGRWVRRRNYCNCHACVNYQELADWARCIVDTRNVIASVQSPEEGYGKRNETRVRAAQRTALSSVTRGLYCKAEA